MRLLPAMETKWRSGVYVGDQRYMARVTVQRPKMAIRSYGLMTTYTYTQGPLSGTPTFTDLLNSFKINVDKGHKVTQVYADYLFTPVNTPVELRNVKSLSWNRSLDQDAATMTLVLYNTIPRESVWLKLGTVAPPSTKVDLDQPGYYTYNRGTSATANRWAHVRNAMAGLLMPDNVIRTFEGYGFDADITPELDPNLAQTGTWMIDSVTMTALGLMTVTCRDLARLLLDHTTMQPVLPKDWDQPLTWDTWDDPIPGDPVRTRVPLTFSTSSNHFGPYKGPDGTYGPLTFDPDNYRHHRSTDPLDDRGDTYWMSFSHIKPRWPWAVEWWEAQCKPSRIEHLKLWLVRHGYQVWVSIYADGHWRNAKGLPAGSGDKLIPWSANPATSRDQQAQIPYVMSFIADSKYESLTDFALPVPIEKVTKIRFTFTNLQALPGITPLNGRNFRVGIRGVQAYGALTASTRKLKVGPAGSNPGRYSDYSDIVKLCCAWAGLYWPTGAKVRYADGSVHDQAFTKPDPVLGNVQGRVWGDFEETGTGGIARIQPEQLEKKYLMDVINLVREVTGFVFFTDEFGAVQWRLPNIYQPGNWISDNTVHAGRTVRVPVIDERQNLMSLDATIASNNVRETFQVRTWNKTATAAGFNPNPTGLRRVGLWADDRFEDSDVQRAADMITVRSLFTYRRDRTTIPGFPGIQVDDQVRIYERVTGEGYIHYVTGIQSNGDLESGEWTYELTTNWLGDKPDSQWIVPQSQLPNTVVQQLIKQRLRRQIRKPNTPSPIGVQPVRVR